MSHTPGPWRRGQEGNLRVYGPDATQDAGVLAEVIPHNGQQSANARLIAAAPDLLHCVSNVLAMAIKSGWAVSTDVTKRQAVDFMRTAIAKAEGRS